MSKNSMVKVLATYGALTLTAKCVEIGFMIAKQIKTSMGEINQPMSSTRHEAKDPGESSENSDFCECCCECTCDADPCDCPKDDQEDNVSEDPSED